MPKLSKAERKAQHAEQNRLLWQSAYVTSRLATQARDPRHMPWRWSCAEICTLS